MNVLIINTVSFHLNGITSVIMNYYRHMDRAGMQIDFVAGDGISEDYRAELEKSGATVHCIPRKPAPLKYMRQLYRTLKAGGYDIVHIHGNSAMMLFDILPAVWAKVRVRFVHAHNTSCSHMTMHKLFAPFFHRCYTHGFACGEKAGHWLYGERPFTVLKNGVELRQYRYDSAVRETYRRKINAGSRTVIGHVGCFSDVKNHTFLLDVFVRLMERDPHYLLLLIGEGDLMDQMRLRVQQLGIEDSVLFLGKTTKVAQYMQAMDIFVLPSLHEGLPVVLVEAQAAGLPCLVSDRVAAEANLTGELQYLTIEDPALWAQQIAAVDMGADRTARCTDWQERLSVAGYDIATNADRMRELYTQCYERQKGQPL